jgi:dTDP-3-amino-2,3,6-trideoxy-4-keto-D-glucose/dTDP-3-amino-3,4,6-trideoxy-alpha-D-glucose/dTDP-2,6-dideoxy-D-kanosamine transaminase
VINKISINVWSYLKEYENEREEILAAVDRVFSSGRLLFGESLKGIEQEYSDYCGVKYGVGCDNGTNAIVLALLAVGVKEGDEVITVSNTAVPTISAIVSAGAIPKFVDIHPETFLMDTSKIESAVTKKTRCILPVHLYGQCVDMNKIHEIAQHYDLKVVEDCAQSHGSGYWENKAGSMSDASATSFYPTKILGGYGDGGMVLSNNEQTAKKLRRLRFYGMEKDYYAEEHGYNSRLDEVQAEILRWKLKNLDKYISKRRQLAFRYNDLLKDTSLILPKTAQGNMHVYYLYVVRSEQRNDIISKLKNVGINCNISYPWPVHVMRGYSNLGYECGDLPETELAAKEIFSLPMYPSLTIEEQDYVCDKLKEMLLS